MGKLSIFLKRFVIFVAVVSAAVGGFFYISLEDRRTDFAVRQAVRTALDSAEKEKAEAVRVAVAEAVKAEREAAKAKEPPPRPKSEAKLDTDDATRALFPKGAYLLELDGDGRGVTCQNGPERVQWVRLSDKDFIRSTIERYEVSASRFLAGLLTFGLSTFYGPETPIQTIFSARTEGAYTTLVLGALRDEDDDELVGPQIRMTLYRVDSSTFGLVERAQVDEPPVARPAAGAPKYSQLFRRCAYQGRIVDL